MSIEPANSCPPNIKTVLEIWSATMAEAKLTNADAVSAACMLLACICMGGQPDKEDAHTVFSETIYDIHKFIDDNWAAQVAMREKNRKKRNG